MAWEMRLPAINSRMGNSSDSDSWSVWTSTVYPLPLSTYPHFIHERIISNKSIWACGSAFCVLTSPLCIEQLRFVCVCVCVCVLVTQLCPALCHPTDCSPPGSSVHGILQARILEWVASPSSMGSSQSRDQTQVSCIAGRFFTIWATREAQDWRPTSLDL